MKWSFKDNGSISSVNCPDFVIGTGGGMGSNNMLTHNVEVDSQVWIKVNTRLLAASEAGWDQEWNVDFIEKYDGTLPSHIGDFNDITTCYLTNPAFSASF